MSAERRPITVAIGLGRPAAGVARPAPATTPQPAAEARREEAPHPDRHTPLIDIHDGPDGLVLEADLPGATEQTLAVQVEDNVLSLHARVVPAVPDDARPIHQEYRVGEYQRSFILSDEVDRAGIAAELKNGVLRLTLPRAERTKTRRIEIKTPS
jgi:HSP20 family protein